MSKVPNPLLGVLGRALEGALNRVLALDAESAQRMRALESRAIELSWSGAGLGLRIGVRDGRLCVGPLEDAAPDLSVSSTLAGFVGMLFPARADTPLTAGKVQISGDAELARRLEQLVREFEPDIEGAFTRVLGATAGPVLARTLKSGFDWARSSATTLAQDGAEYLRDETGDIVAREELDAFADAVDRVRDDAERLAARVARLRPERET